MKILRNPTNPLFVLAAAALLSACGQQIPDSLTIAVAQPLSGPQAGRGQDLLNGAKLAIDEINKSGFKIGGKPVTLELLSVDDKADAAEAKKVAQELVDKKVFAVLGHLSSEITEATIPIYKQGNVVQLFTSSAAELTKLGDGNTFRLVANDELQAKAVASYAADTLKAGTVAIVHENSAYGNPMNSDVAAALTKAKKKVGLQESVDSKATDFAPVVAKLKAAPPDVVVAALRDHQLLPLLQQMKAAGLSDVPVIATSTGKTTKVEQKMKAVPPPQPPFGRLRTISSDKFAAVYVNGKFMGHVDEFSNPTQGLLLNPGEYKVRIAPVKFPMPLPISMMRRPRNGRIVSNIHSL